MRRFPLQSRQQSPLQTTHRRVRPWPAAPRGCSRLEPLFSQALGAPFLSSFSHLIQHECLANYLLVNKVPISIELALFKIGYFFVLGKQSEL